MTIYAIVWDIGGVLERTEDFNPRRKLADRLGIEMDALTHLIFGHKDKHRVQVGEIALEEHWENVRKELGVSEEELVQIFEEFFGSDRLDYALVDFIRALKTNYCSAVLSNYFPTLRKKIIEEWQIDDAFHHLFISSEIGLMKPNPEIYELVLERIGFEANQTVFIDDFIENVKGAKEVGMHGILFESPEQVKRELNELLNR
jgi:epoxide hydrolase-like predicted phosphatase